MITVDVAYKICRDFYWATVEKERDERNRLLAEEYAKTGTPVITVEKGPHYIDAVETDPTRTIYWFRKYGNVVCIYDDRTKEFRFGQAVVASRGNVNLTADEMKEIVGMVPA